MAVLQEGIRRESYSLRWL